jgi:hypothetical protein
MAYRTAVDAIVVAPAGGLGTSSPTHRQMHDADRAGIREIADYLDAGGATAYRIVTGLVVNSARRSYGQHNGVTGGPQRSGDGWWWRG